MYHISSSATNLALPCREGQQEEWNAVFADVHADMANQAAVLIIANVEALYFCTAFYSSSGVS